MIAHNSRPSPPLTALVTGASRGIGRGVALSLANRGYGLTVTSRSHDDLLAVERELLDAGAFQVTHLPADLAARTSLAEIVELHRSTYGSMDALILNAGIGTAGPIAGYSMKRLDKTLDVNVVSAFVLLQEALPLLRQAAAARPGRGAKVILLSSITGIYAEAGLAAYGAAKAALLSLAETLNVEESGHGVAATALAPAFVETDMSVWATDRVPAESMVPVADVVAMVGALLELSHRTTVSRVVLSRSGTHGYCA
jgi:3-oxoacyl-[acyl-carrier protein] reductase